MFNRDTIPGSLMKKAATLRGLSILIGDARLKRQFFGPESTFPWARGRAPCGS
jgi:Ca2+/H+ antiporter